MANNKKQQGSQHLHPQAASLENKEHVVNAQIAKLQGFMESFQKTIIDELRQIRVAPELKFPIFRNDDANLHPLDWLSKADRFFKFYKVPEDQKVDIASFHLQGRDALEWLILYELTSSSSSWPHFVEQFLTRFGGYGNIDGDLLRLNQDGVGGGVDDYITQFLRLVSRASKKWTDSNLKDFFINGLQDSLRDDVRLYKPESLSEAIELARALNLKEEKSPQEMDPDDFIPNLPRYQVLFMGKTRVKMLFTSSTHNFIGPNVLKGADRELIIKEDDPLLVRPLALIENWVTTVGRINAEVNMQGFKYVADFYILPKLLGCDMLLGNEWMESIGSYTVGPTGRSFTANGRNYQLTAEKYSPRSGTVTQPHTMSLEGIRRSGRA